VQWFKNNWATVVTIGCLVLVAFIEAWDQASGGLPASSHVPKLGGSWRFVPLMLLVLAGITWLIDHRGHKETNQAVAAAASQPPAISLGIPTLSGLLGQNPEVEFDAKKYLALAYYSPVTAEAEKNIKAIADKQYPNAREDFYVRFIGVGLVTVQHEMTWLMIFASQLAALEELNSRGLIPITDLKKHYDKAAAASPAVYATYSFDQWLSFLKLRMEIATYPSGMVELSWGGRDFLRYLAHVGYNLDSRKN
jgi:hypothetical protein